ncbi:hypothetical protein JMJ77_0012229 [Colletotrichum scovillei]|uniref:Ankyrin repeat protein n=1 Tax=Colletotrichum scovillei TaxID=1209932 RepID=A0A9P7U4K7_9PEZI|nr:hypothetical protein JMJ78_0001280 [Colletotrichum scovillei]KAG7041711.1 hypothetical protein JMJ77_0012229 [Colletotrichum scovillei]KAG7061741.1 hypothetical protein JMJ76_0003698 [Colletotrichum scovillei]
MAILIVTVNPNTRSFDTLPYVILLELGLYLDGFWEQHIHLVHAVKSCEMMETAFWRSSPSGWIEEATPLVAVIDADHPSCDVIRTLIRFKADPNLRDNSTGRMRLSPLQTALTYNRPSLAEVLIDDGADIDEPSGTHCSEDPVALLLRRGVNLARTTREAGAGPKPLIMAAKLEVSFSSFERLLLHGAQAESETKSHLEETLSLAKGSWGWWLSRTQRRRVRNTARKLRILSRSGQEKLSHESAQV